MKGIKDPHFLRSFFELIITASGNLCFIETIEKIIVWKTLAVSTPATPLFI